MIHNRPVPSIIFHRVHVKKKKKTASDSCDVRGSGLSHLVHNYTLQKTWNIIYTIHMKYENVPLPFLVITEHSKTTSSGMASVCEDCLEGEALACIIELPYVHLAAEQSAISLSKCHNPGRAQAASVRPQLPRLHGPPEVCNAPPHHLRGGGFGDDILGDCRDNPLALFMFPDISHFWASSRPGNREVCSSVDSGSVSGRLWVQTPRPAE